MPQQPHGHIDAALDALDPQNMTRTEGMVMVKGPVLPSGAPASACPHALEPRPAHNRTRTAPTGVALPKHSARCTTDSCDADPVHCVKLSSLPADFCQVTGQGNWCASHVGQPFCVTTHKYAQYASGQHYAAVDCAGTASHCKSQAGCPTDRRLE